MKLASVQIRAGLFLLFLGTATACQGTVSGTWTGKMGSPDAIGVRFAIEDKDGELTGRTFWQDPVTHEFEPEAEFTGTRSNHSASWTTETAVVITGQFDGDTFAGTIAFPRDGDEPEHTTTLSLKR